MSGRTDTVLGDPIPSGLPRLLRGLPAGGAPMSAEAHLAAHGPLPSVAPERLLEEIERSGLRGRGGGDFPTARKLQAVRARRGRTALVVNGSETEPAGGKDQLLLSRLPHLVLDGAELAAAAIGARRIVIKVRDSELSAMPALQAAVALRGHGRASIELVAGPEGYVAGEETAVISYLNGGRSAPAFTPPRPFEKGLDGRPTAVQNPETLAQIALVARHGAAWYRQLGTTADPGSALVTISGDVASPGVYELAFGTALPDLLQAAGGGTEPLRAVLIGGYFGTWVDASRTDGLRLAREDLRQAGCSLGSGVMVALGRSGCGLHESARVIDYLATQSAGQCGPCLHGLRALADALNALVDGRATSGQHQRLLRWAQEIRGRGACHHPDGVTRLLESSLNVFADELGAHMSGRCTARAARLPLGRSRAVGRVTTPRKPARREPISGRSG